VFYMAMSAHPTPIPAKREIYQQQPDSCSPDTDS
jgi:hypothetical protein